MTSSYLETLFWKWYTGDYTEAERAELMALAKEPANQEILKTLFEKTWEQPVEGEAFPESSAKGIFDAIIQAGKTNPATVLQPKLWRRRITYIAAASIIFISVCTTLLFVHIHQANPKNMSNISKLQDVSPGGNKAILILSDGSSIVLDSTGNGTLAEQGASRVVKLEPGEVSYESTDNKNASTPIYNALTVPRGGKYALVLPDGSKVWLNAASSLRYPVSFAGLKQREVSLTGEGYFEIAGNSSKPFIVKVNEMEVQVLGTKFNIMAYQDEAEVRSTLIEGAVNILNGNTTALLRPGQQAQLSKKGTIKVTDRVDVEGELAWKEGDFFFKRSNIAVIMRSLARWYDVDIQYTSTTPTDLFNVDIPMNVPLSEVLKILEMTGGVHFQIEGKKLLVLP